MRAPFVTCVTAAVMAGLSLREVSRAQRSEIDLPSSPEDAVQPRHVEALVRVLKLEYVRPPDMRAVTIRGNHGTCSRCGAATKHDGGLCNRCQSGRGRRK